MKLKKTACILLSAVVVLTNLSIPSINKIKAATTPKPFTKDMDKAPNIGEIYTNPSDGATYKVINITSKDVKGWIGVETGYNYVCT